MAQNDEAAEPKQPTQPKEGEPVEIPIPKREDFDKLVRRAAEQGAAANRDESP